MPLLADTDTHYTKKLNHRNPQRNNTIPVLKESLASGSTGAGCSTGRQVSVDKQRIYMVDDEQRVRWIWSQLVYTAHNYITKILRSSSFTFMSLVTAKWTTVREKTQSLKTVIYLADHNNDLCAILNQDNTQGTVYIYC